MGAIPRWRLRRASLTASMKWPMSRPCKIDLAVFLVGRKRVAMHQLCAGMPNGVNNPPLRLWPTVRHITYRQLDPNL